MAVPQILRTPAEKAIIEQFGGVVDTLPAAESRRAAFRRFEATGLPHRRMEEWRYTDLRASLRSAAPPALAEIGDEAASAALATSVSPWDDVEVDRLLFVDGAFIHGLSAELAAGARFRTLARTLAAGDAVPQPLERPFTDPTEPLNTAFARDGALIDIAADAAIERPIALVHVASVGEAKSATVRHVVTVGAGARVTFVERWTSPAGQGGQTNAAIELRIAPHAHVTWIKVQAEGDATVHLGTLVTEIADSATLDHVVVSTGAALARNQVFARLDGDDINFSTAGATLARGARHLDSTLVVEHRGHGAVSRELYKAVVDDRAQSIFQGKIIVTRAAQKTDARMASHSVLLSDEAEAIAKPELEIFADDVQCGHGATCGELDERLRFYLQSRGIPRAEAERLLVVAFLGEVVDRIAHEKLHAAALATVDTWLAERG